MDKVYLGRKIAEFSPGIASQPISKVELLDENGDVVAFAGDDTGKTLTALHPDGTGEMARAILGKVKGYAHTGYEGSDALLNIAAEVGDAMTVAGHYVPLVEQEINFSALCASGISSPDADELDDEYPYKSATQRQIERNMAKARSLITKTSEEIMLKVEGIDGRVTSLSTSIDGIRSEVSGKIDGKNAQSMIDQSLKGITMSASSGADGTTFKLMANGAELSTQTFDLHVKSVNIDGALTIGQLPKGVAQTSQIPTHTSQLTNNSGYQTEQGVTQIIKGTVTTDYIYALGVEASTLRGNQVGLKDGNGNTVGGIALSYTTTGVGLGLLTSQGGIQIQSAGNLFLSAGTGGSITVQSGRVQLGAAALCLATASYGYGAPSGAGVAGQIYVQLRQ
jgi:hypothetical protein|nr:MAG TPA_asm: hypothetical protein [Caudoviricetes sp.]